MQSTGDAELDFGTEKNTTPENCDVVMVVSDNPFELSVRQESRKLRAEYRTPQILVLIDCPFDFVGIDSEFSEVVRYEEDYPDALLKTINHVARQNSTTPNPQTASVLGCSDFADATRMVIRELVRNENPILIHGEFGTGRKLIVRCIHAVQNQNQLVYYTSHSRISEAYRKIPVSSKRMMRERENSMSQFDDSETTTWVLDDDSGSAQGLAKLLKEGDRIIAVCQSGNAANFQNEILNLSKNNFETINIQTQPIRIRPEDSMEIAADLFVKAQNSMGLFNMSLDASTRKLINEYHWPGNVYELKLALLGGVLFHESGRVTADGLHPWLIDTDRTRDLGDEGSKSFEASELAHQCSLIQHRLHLAMIRRLRDRESVADIIDRLFTDRPKEIWYSDRSHGEQKLSDAA